MALRGFIIFWSSICLKSLFSRNYLKEGKNERKVP